MARVELTEIVLQPQGHILAYVDGADVIVNVRDGAQAPVYDAATGSTELDQPLTTRYGRVEPVGNPGGEVWVPAGSYDLLVTVETVSGPITTTQRFEAAPGKGSSSEEISLADYGLDFKTSYSAASSGLDAVALINQAAADAYAQGRKLVVGQGGWLRANITSGNPIVIPDIAFDLSDLQLRVHFTYPVAAETPVILVEQDGGGSDNEILERTMKLPALFNGNRAGSYEYTPGQMAVRWITGATTTASQKDIGYRLVNCRGCRIEVPSATDFSFGLDTMGKDGSGFTYNTVLLGRVVHNRVNHRLGQLDATGWCTQNTFIGGSYNHFDVETGERLAGVRHILIPHIADADYIVNGNKWINTGIEGKGAEFEAEIYGQSNEFDCRWEKAGSFNPRVWWRASTQVAKRNVVKGMFAEQVEETRDAGAVGQGNGIDTPALYTIDEYQNIVRAAANDVIRRLFVAGEANARIAEKINGWLLGNGSGSEDLGIGRAEEGVFIVEGLGVGGRSGLFVKRVASQAEDLIEAHDESNVVLWAVTKDGRQRIVSANTQTTVGAAGSASALPGVPRGWIKTVVNGVDCVVPYWVAS